jgi:hypothetical protein
VLVLDRQHTAGHLDVRNFAQRRSQHGQQIDVERHLGEPQPGEPLVARLGQLADAGFDRRPVVEIGYQADSHGLTFRRWCG